MVRTYSNNLFETGNTIVPKAMKKLGLLKEYKKNKIFYSWGDIVGEDIAKYIIPQEVKYGVLYVYAYSSVWANNFQYLKLDIIDKINEEAGYKIIKDIQFTRFKKKVQNNYSPIWEQKVNLGKCLQKVVITDDDKIKIDKQLKNIEDTDLRRILISVRLKSIQLSKLKKDYGWHECKRCGKLSPPQETYCVNCQRVLHQEKLDKITEIFQAVPWVKYQDIVKYVDCDINMVNKQRLKLVQIWASYLQPEVDYPVDNQKRYSKYNLSKNLQANMNENYSEQAKKVVMLYKSIPPDKLNKAVLKEVIGKLRYDTAYWQYKKGKQGQ